MHLVLFNCVYIIFFRYFPGWLCCLDCCCWYWWIWSWYLVKWSNQRTCLVGLHSWCETDDCWCKQDGQHWTTIQWSKCYKTLLKWALSDITTGEGRLYHVFVAQLFDPFLIQPPPSPHPAEVDICDLLVESTGGSRLPVHIWSRGKPPWCNSWQTFTVQKNTNFYCKYNSVVFNILH